jgi:hypothetical protein
MSVCLPASAADAAQLQVEGAGTSLARSGLHVAAAPKRAVRFRFLRGECVWRCGTVCKGGGGGGGGGGREGGQKSIDKNMQFQMSIIVSRGSRGYKGR